MISMKDRIKNFERYSEEIGKRGANTLYLNTEKLNSVHDKLTDHYPELVTMKLSKKIEYIHYLFVEYLKINGEFLLTQTGSPAFQNNNVNNVNNNDKPEINNELEVKTKPTQDELDNYNATIAEIDADYNEEYNANDKVVEYNSDNKPF